MYLTFMENKKMTSKVTHFWKWLLVGALFSLQACTISHQQQREPEAYRAASRQAAPDPVYRRLRWGHLPAVIPAKAESKSATPMMKPVMKFELTNVRLDRLAKLFAETAQYNSYCASAIADKRISLRMLGTLDEAAAEVEKKAAIDITIDHDTRSVRFMPEESAAPAFFEDRLESEEVMQDEYQSTH